MAQYQRDRIYSLIVGTEQDAVEINNLQIKFKVTKTSNNKDKKNDAYVEISNLSSDRRKALEQPYIQVTLKVGYADTELLEVFSGEVVNISNSKIGSFLTERNSTNLVTRLDLDELYTALNATTLSSVVPAGKTIRDVILAIVKDMPTVTRQEMNGEAVKKTVPDGYPLTGTPRQNLDKLSKDYELEYQIDSGVLYVSDYDGTFSDDTSTVYSIGQFSGLIERPEFINEDSKRIKRERGEKKDRKNKNKPKKNTLKFKILLNPAIIAGSIVKLEFEDLTGYYKVDEVIHEGDFRGNTWYSTLTCSEKVE